MHVFRSSYSRRRGVSLLEVLISIGVTSIGLLGVLSLIPLGGAQTRQGQVLERAATIGPAAMAEVRARDMLAPMNWITTTGTAGSGYLGTSFCIDPMDIASIGPASAPATFPALGTAKMPRLALWNYMIGPPDNTANPSKIMSLPLARTIFQSHDDLRIVDLQRDRTLPPLAVWERISNDATNTDLSKAPLTPTRRQDEGHMSWMITAFPNLAKGSPYDLYTVSIVVFNRRIMDSAIRSEFTTNVIPNATGFPGGGVSGGDVIVSFDTSTYSADEIREAKTPENSWVLLSGQVPVPNSNPINVFQWYRVLGSEQTNTNERQLTLAGPDWPVSNTANPVQNTQMTIIPGTVAVYQENMQIEGTSLWRK
jgi:hypothetical protein